jgi:signal peptide peptidase SppA
MKTLILAIKQAFVQEAIEARESRKAAYGEAATSMQAGSDDSFFGKMAKDWMEQTAMKISGPVATIPIRGAISQDDPWSAYFGETSVKMITDNFRSALANEDVKKIVFDVSSPGGYIWGIEALSDEIYAARDKKEIVAYTGQMAASAAYWIASAASKVYAGSETSEVGSIGVYLAHFDYSEALGKMGVKVTEVTAGEFKGIGSPYTPLDATDKKLLQNDVNHVYGRFVGAVARNRGMAEAEVLKSANGLVFFGSDAKAKGLIDGISTFQEVTKMDAKDQEKLQQAEKAAAEATAKAAAAEAKALAAEAALKATTEAAAKAAKEAAEAECKATVKAHMGREATEKEVSAYAAMSPDQREVFKATHEENSKNRKELIAKTGLTEEQATRKDAEGASHGGDLLMAAAAELGFVKKT